MRCKSWFGVRRSTRSDISRRTTKNRIRCCRTTRNGSRTRTRRTRSRCRTRNGIGCRTRTRRTRNGMSCRTRTRRTRNGIRCRTRNSFLSKDGGISKDGVLCCDTATQVGMSCRNKPSQIRMFRKILRHECKTKKTRTELHNILLVSENHRT